MYEVQFKNQENRYFNKKWVYYYHYYINYHIHNTHATHTFIDVAI